jgi:transcriptional regulator with XRE-family HTH domain
MKRINPKEVKNLIRTKRAELCLTQKEFSKLIGVSATAIADWERGVCPTTTSMMMIEKYFEIAEIPNPEQSMLTKEMILTAIEKLNEKLAVIEKEELAKEDELFTITIDKDVRKYVLSQCEKLGVDIAQYVNMLVYDLATGGVVI